MQTSYYFLAFIDVFVIATNGTLRNEENYLYFSPSKSTIMRSKVRSNERFSSGLLLRQVMKCTKFHKARNGTQSFATRLTPSLSHERAVSDWRHLWEAPAKRHWMSTISDTQFLSADKVTAIYATEEKKTKCAHFVSPNSFANGNIAMGELGQYFVAMPLWC